MNEQICRPSRKETKYNSNTKLTYYRGDKSDMKNNNSKKYSLAFEEI